MSDPEPKAEQGTTGWAKTMHPDLGNELMRRWNAYEPMTAEIARLRSALHGAIEATDLDEVGLIARRALEQK